MANDRPYIEINTAAGNKQLILGREPVSIGRHSENKLVLADNLASRFHCVIEKAPDGYLLRDLGASNGTFVNGRKVKSALLQPGDTVRVGNTELVLILPDGEAPPTLNDLAEVIEMHEANSVDELSEEDLVVDDGSPGGFGMAGAGGGNGAPMDLSDYEHSLRRMAEGAFNKPFGETDIALVNPRGQVVHPAGPTKGGGERTVTDLFRLLLLVSFRGRATDIHLEPKGEFYALRLRSDGVMVDAARLPNPIGVRLGALVKIMCEIDPAQKTAIQEGHFSSRVPDTGPTGVGGQRRVDYRVSFAPSVFGQKLVVRILDAATAPATIKNLMLPDWMEEEMSRSVEQDAGMVLVCGPTGSGKTSTLYSVVRSLDLMQRNVITIEDPVEIQIEGVTQLPVDDEKGKGFAELLRTVLRQDPDVILVGEIRDAETARIAMQAAITGHLVFSTVHTKDTVGTIFRLLDLGIEPYLLTQALQLVLAQRLVRRLCPQCKKPSKLTEQQRKRMGEAAAGVDTIYNAVGCYRCLNTGFVGRRAVFEMLNTTEELRDAIVQNPTSAEISKALSGFRFQKLQHSAYELVAAGEVAFDEADRAIGR
jgi:type II secretory ATPase GspE/PulE/Tfp pilus assembly ATPase PilB-like protein/pSer/pThr/pTyr-binding forkhead associated (FHA) protein